jgi:hypothetical protein
MMPNFPVHVCLFALHTVQMYALILNKKKHQKASVFSFLTRARMCMQAVAINTYLALLGSSVSGLLASALFTGSIKVCEQASANEI